MQNSKQFVNPAFAAIYDGITANMPSITFWGIIVTYLVTAALNVHFIPLPLFISIPAALAIQFGRFSVVFMDFLNPTGYRSPWPGIIATLATVTALAELAFSLGGIDRPQSGFWSLFLFGGMFIAFGYILELNFIRKGAEAFGMTSRQRPAGATNYSPIQQQSTASQTAVKQSGEVVYSPLEFPLPPLSSNGNGKHH